MLAYFLKLNCKNILQNIITLLVICSHSQYGPGHPLAMLGNFIGVSNLQNLQNIQHNDVLEKLKLQVRDMKVGFMVSAALRLQEFKHVRNIYSRSL